MTILEAIQHANSDKEIRQLLNVGNANKSSGETRRGWLAAARARRIELNIVQVKPSVIKVIAKRKEARRKHLRTFFRALFVQAQPEPKPQ